MADTPPEPIDLVAARRQVRLDEGDTSEDADLAPLIVAAREFVEGYTGLVLTPRTVVESAPSLGIYVDLRAWPVRSVTSIGYLDGAGTAQVIDPARWYPSVARRPVRLRPKTGGWGVPIPGCQPIPISVTVEAGYATPNDVPAVVKQAMLLLIGHWFANREAVMAGSAVAAIETPFAVTALLRGHRVQRV